MTNVQACKQALESHMARHSGELLERGTFAAEEFDKLYNLWIQARWDEGDKWVRSTWRERP